MSGLPVAIIDIGSNSVRLVIYEDHTRAPTPIYNEKLMCGLGRGVAVTGRLPEDAVGRALEALRRYRVLCRTAGVGSVHVLATAAARDASNGPAFLEAAAEAAGYPVELLTGEREASLSAYGVISGFDRPDGLVGDLGGGSLELIDVAQQAARSGATFPLGGLVLHDRAGGSVKAAVAIVREELARAKQLRFLKGRTFYAVGGTWRALARMQMVEQGYPLHVMHGYAFDLGQDGFLRMLDRKSPAALKALGSVAEGRRPLLAYGAAVLDEIVRVGQPARVTVSAVGVREGLLYTNLDPETRDVDSLLAVSDELNRARSRSPRHGEELRAWTDEVMRSLAFDETEGERRLRHAACLLSDVGWRAHPDYRAEQSLALIMNAALLGVTHPERVYLALSVFFRHEGLSAEGADITLRMLAGPRLVTRARILAGCLRVAYAITVACAGVLPRTPLGVVEGRLVLRLPPDLAPLASERLSGRLRALGKLVERESAIAFS